MFLIMLRYNQSMLQVKALQKDHINWLKTYFTEGIFIADDRKIPCFGKVILAPSMARD